jgi:small subunit ribosomal protein S16
MGKRGERKFRIVVKEKRSSRDGQAIETLGWYEKGKDGGKRINKERIAYWVAQGAMTTPAIEKLL